LQGCCHALQSHIKLGTAPSSSVVHGGLATAISVVSATGYVGVTVTTSAVAVMFECARHLTWVVSFNNSLIPRIAMTPTFQMRNLRCAVAHAGGQSLH
jgi:hypothetical protein